MVEQRLGGVEISDLPCLASGQNSNFTSDDMADLRRQGIAVDDNSDPVPEKLLPPKALSYHNWKRVTVG